MLANLPTLCELNRDAWPHIIWIVPCFLAIVLGFALVMPN